MKQEKLKIGEAPAIIWGEPSQNLYLFIHGQGGNKEETKFLSQIVCNSDHSSWIS